MDTVSQYGDRCVKYSVNCTNFWKSRNTFENINFRKSISIYIVIIIKKKKEDCVSLYDKEFTPIHIHASYIAKKPKYYQLIYFREIFAIMYYPLI